MSIGSGVGLVVGGVIGYVIGGPAGALEGAFIGMGVGGGIQMLVDPIEPNVAKPDPAQLAAPTAHEGAPIADALGLVQMSGNFIWYCCPWTKKIKEDSGGKGGGGGKVVKGYKYYLSFAIGLCRGPVDVLYCIYEDDKLLWEGPLSLSDATYGHVTISVEDRGEIDFYFGTTDQVADSFMSGKTEYALPYKGICYAVFRDFMIGKYNRVGRFKFLIKKRPAYSFDSYQNIGDYNYNPAHALYHLLATDVGLSDDQIDDQSFSDAADTLHTEQLGVSVPMKMEKPLIRYIESICQHIRACLYVNAAGKIALRLYRKDVETENMLIIDENDVLEEIGIERQSMIDAKNEVQVRTNTITEE